MLRCPARACVAGVGLLRVSGTTYLADETRPRAEEALPPKT
jgi:hypothetical protein